MRLQQQACSLSSDDERIAICDCGTNGYRRIRGLTSLLRYCLPPPDTYCAVFTVYVTRLDRPVVSFFSFAPLWCRYSDTGVPVSSDDRCRCWSGRLLLGPALWNKPKYIIWLLPWNAFWHPFLTVWYVAMIIIPLFNVSCPRNYKNEIKS